MAAASAQMTYGEKPIQDSLKRNLGAARRGWPVAVKPVFPSPPGRGSPAAVVGVGRAVQISAAAPEMGLPESGLDPARLESAEAPLS